jgi:hypothetical protein
MEKKLNTTNPNQIGRSGTIESGVTKYTKRFVPMRRVSKTVHAFHVSLCQEQKALRRAAIWVPPVRYPRTMCGSRCHASASLLVKPVRSGLLVRSGALSVLLHKKTHGSSFFECLNLVKHENIIVGQSTKYINIKLI